MTDDEYWPPRLRVVEYRHNPPDRTTWIKVEGFRTMDLGIEEGDLLYVLKTQDIIRFMADLNDTESENAALRKEIRDYREYFRLQNELSDKEADDAQR